MKMEEQFLQVHSFIMDVTPLFIEENYIKIYQQMPDFRRAKADQLLHREDRARSVGAWYLKMLADRRFGETSGDSFNLAHSGRYVMCSVAPAGIKVGCDVEMIGNFRENVARRFFCREEYAHIMSQGESMRGEWFYRYWVLKESLAKATRKGLSIGLDSFGFRFDGDLLAGVFFAEAEGQQATEEKNWFFQEYSLPDARAAVCAAGQVTEKERKGQSEENLNRPEFSSAPEWIRL